MSCACVYPLLFRVLRFLHYNDFGKFYYSTQLSGRTAVSCMALTQLPLIPFGPERAEQFWNMNPPHFHFLIWPLTFFPIERAYELWAFANLTALVVAIVAIARAVPIKASPATWVGVSVLVAASAPAQSWGLAGQLTGLLVGAVTSIWLLSSPRSVDRSGDHDRICVTSITAPFLAPLILAICLIFRKQWRAVVVAGDESERRVSLGLAVFGVQNHRDWLAALGDARWTGAVMNASVLTP